MSQDDYVFLVYVVGPFVGAMAGALLAPVLFYGAQILFYYLPLGLWQSWNAWRAKTPGTKQYRARQKRIKDDIIMWDHMRQQRESMREQIDDLNNRMWDLRLSIAIGTAP